MKTLISVFLSTFCIHAFAGYRVYQLKLEYLGLDGTVTKEREIRTNLDPYQYEHYHAGYGRMRVQMVDTWFCPGDTSFKSYCDKPKVREMAPTSQQDPKRLQLPQNRQPVIP